MVQEGAGKGLRTKLCDTVLRRSTSRRRPGSRESGSGLLRCTASSFFLLFIELTSFKRLQHTESMQTSQKYLFIWSCEQILLASCLQWPPGSQHLILVSTEQQAICGCKNSRQDVGEEIKNSVYRSWNGWLVMGCTVIPFAHVKGPTVIQYLNVDTQCAVTAFL